MDNSNIPVCLDPLIFMDELGGYFEKPIVSFPGFYIIELQKYVAELLASDAHIESEFIIRPLLEKIVELKPSSDSDELQLELVHYGINHIITYRLDWILKEALKNCFRDICPVDASLLSSKIDGLRRAGRWEALGDKQKNQPHPRVKYFRKKVEVEVEQLIGKYCEILSQKTSPVRINRLFKERLLLVVTWGDERKYSRGGYYKSKSAPFVALSLKNLVEDGASHFIEYRAFDSDPVIGSCSGSWRVYIAALVAHEISHAVQFSCLSGQGFVEYKREVVLSKPHGQGWREVYFYLRKEFVNNCSTYEKL